MTTNGDLPMPRTMFEARLTQGNLLKLIIDAMKDLVQDANFECSDSAISVQVFKFARFVICRLWIHLMCPSSHCLSARTVLATIVVIVL